MNSSFIFLPFSTLAQLPCWNLNFHRFEGLDNSEKTYLAGTQDAYSLLIEDFELHPNRENYAKLNRYKNIEFGLYEKFSETFQLIDSSLHIKSRENEYSLESAYWAGVEDVHRLFIFLANYNHIKIYTNDIIQQHPSLKNYRGCYYRANISTIINVYSLANNNKYTNDILNKDNRDFIYLDEIFGINALANGYYLTVKKSIEDFLAL